MSNAIEITKLKRYVGSIDFYLYAENDAEAKQQLMEIAAERRKQNDDCASALSLCEKPIGINNAREIKLT